MSHVERTRSYRELLVEMASMDIVEMHAIELELSLEGGDGGWHRLGQLGIIFDPLTIVSNPIVEIGKSAATNHSNGILSGESSRGIGSYIQERLKSDSGDLIKGDLGYWESSLSRSHQGFESYHVGIIIEGSEVLCELLIPLDLTSSLITVSVIGPSARVNHG